VENVQDSALLPEPVRPAGVTVHAVLFAVKVTTPENPFRPVIVIVEVPVEPAFTVTLVGLAESVKSVTVNVTVVEWDNDPLVPVTVTSTVCAALNVHESVELPEPTMLVGDNVHEVLLLARLTPPAEP